MKHTNKQTNKNAADENRRHELREALENIASTTLCAIGEYQTPEPLAYRTQTLPEDERSV